MKPMQNNATRAKPMAIPRTTCEEPEEDSLEMTSSGLSVVVVFIVWRICVVVDVEVVEEVSVLVEVEEDGQVILNQLLKWIRWQLLRRQLRHLWPSWQAV